VSNENILHKLFIDIHSFPATFIISQLVFKTLYSFSFNKKKILRFSRGSELILLSLKNRNFGTDST